jgi:hypothetical protein
MQTVHITTCLIYVTCNRRRRRPWTSCRQRTLSGLLARWRWRSSFLVPLQRQQPSRRRRRRWKAALSSCTGDGLICGQHLVAAASAHGPATEVQQLAAGLGRQVSLALDMLAVLFQHLCMWVAHRYQPNPAGLRLRECSELVWSCSPLVILAFGSVAHCSEAAHRPLDGVETEIWLLAAGWAGVHACCQRCPAVDPYRRCA